MVDELLNDKKEVSFQSYSLIIFSVCDGTSGSQVSGYKGNRKSKKPDIPDPLLGLRNLWLCEINIHPIIGFGKG